MFYREYYIKYPSKSIVEDLLTRSGEPDKSTFTPYAGKAYLIEEQWRGASSVPRMKRILNYISEFDPVKAKPTREVAGDREDAINEINEYLTRLEEIDESYIIKHLREQLIGYKVHNDGELQDKIADSTYEGYYDEEGEYQHVADNSIPENDLLKQDVIDAKMRLPYVLKQLHRGSKLYKGSLLSFIIARQQAIDESDGSKTVSTIKPMDLYTRAVWKMTPDGRFDSFFTADSNKSEPFRSLVEWTMGHRLDSFYKYAEELLSICAILDVDITREESLEFQEGFINKASCIYLASNMEVIEDAVLGDRMILDMLSEDQLMNIWKQNNEESIVRMLGDYSAVYENIANAMSSLQVHNRLFTRDGRYLIENLFQWIAKSYDSDFEFKIRDFICDQGLLRDSSGEYLTFGISILMKGVNTVGIRDKVVVAGCGLLVNVRDARGGIRYIDLASLDFSRRCLFSEPEWKYTGI